MTAAPCNDCDGRGTWVETTTGHNGAQITVQRTCGTCAGTGVRG